MGRILFHITIITMLMFFVASCMVSKASSNPADILAKPRKAFVQIKAFAVVKICTEKLCVGDSEHISSGSGFVIADAKAGSYVLTAGHLCTSSRYDQIKGFLEQEDVDGDVFYDLYGFTIEFEQHKLKVLNIDTKSDLCLLHAPDLVAPAIAIAKSPPRAGEKVYNVAAPREIMHHSAPIIFGGLYSGRDEPSGYEVFTISVAEGSSGSPIVNERSELVGMISLKSSNFDFLAFSPKLEVIQEFVSDSIDADMERD